MAPRKINQKDYTHYVIVFRNGQPLIESGWSYREDAVDHVKGNLEDTGVKTKIRAKRAMPIDPDDNASWWKYEPGKKFHEQGLEGPQGSPEDFYDPTYLRGIQERAAKALGWSLKDVQSLSLASLREQVRPVSPKLVHELTEAIREMGA